MLRPVWPPIKDSFPTQPPGNRTVRTHAAATIVAVSPHAHHVTVTNGARKMSGARNTSSQITNEVNSARAAIEAVRGQSRPTPDATAMNAQKYARASRAGSPLGTPLHSGVKLPLTKPKTPNAIIVTAKAT